MPKSPRITTRNNEHELQRMDGAVEEYNSDNEIEMYREESSNNQFVMVTPLAATDNLDDGAVTTTTSSTNSTTASTTTTGATTYTNADTVAPPPTYTSNKNYDSDSSIEEITMPSNNNEVKNSYPEGAPSSAGANYRGALVLHDSSSHQALRALQNSIKQPQKSESEDDSRIAFGDNFAATFGSYVHSPNPYNNDPEGAPPAYEETVRYEQWLRSNQLIERRQFPQHRRWHENLINAGRTEAQDNPVIRIDEIPVDDISVGFKNTVLDGLHQDPTLVAPEINSLLGRNTIPLNYSDMPLYVPEEFARETHGDVEAQWANVVRQEFYDDITRMIEFTDPLYSTNYMSAKISGKIIPPNQFLVVSNHNGASSGNDFQIWGPGRKKGYKAASAKTGQMLDTVEGTAHMELTETYVHIPGRFTIIRINENEIGFVVDRYNGNSLQKMLPGRYFIKEQNYAYVGKARLRLSETPIEVEAHTDCQESFVQRCATRLQVILTPPANVAFVHTLAGTQVFPYSNQPYILDAQKNLRFINYGCTNDQIIRANDGSYTIINNLLPSEYVVFQHNTREIIWRHDPDNAAMNRLHLPSFYFPFNGEIHSRAEEVVNSGRTTIVSTKPSQILVVRDPQRNIRFMEAPSDELVILRAGLRWNFVDCIPRSQAEYVYGTIENGDSVVRVIPNNSNWVAILTQEGQLEFYPPPLDGTAYYFYQPQHTYIAMLNKNIEGEQILDVPRIGKVSIVNLTTGSIGACRINNVHFFLNPSPIPYIFTPPNKYINTIPTNEFCVSNHDLHRIYLAPDQRAVVSKDGRVYCLPKDTNEFDVDAQGNGIFVFRSNQLEVYGPVSKNAKNSQLGPMQYFNVTNGEVGYGYSEGELKIWKPGLHSVDNRRNEWFEGFFATNVDPVEIKEYHVTSSHNITSHIDIYVTYSITEPNLTIKQFKDHDELHKFIAETTKSEVLNLCATRPPIGYSDEDFNAGSNKIILAKSEEKPDEHEALEEIEDSFAHHVNVLFHKYGIELSRMRITKWDLDPAFVKLAKENASKLLNARAANSNALMEVEAEKIALQKQKVQYDAQMLELEQSKEQARVEAEKTAIQRAANAEADARATAANAKADADASVAKTEGKLREEQLAAEMKLKVADIETQEATKRKELNEIENQTITNRVRAEAAQAKLNAVAKAEIKAAAATAEESAKAEAHLRISKTTLESAQITAEARQIEAESLRGLAEAESEAAELRGLAEAKVAAAKEQAKYPGLDPAQRYELELRSRQTDSLAKLIPALLEAGISVPGLVNVDKGIFDQMLMSQAYTAQTAQAQQVMAMQGVPMAALQGQGMFGNQAAPAAALQGQGMFANQGIQAAAFQGQGQAAGFGTQMGNGLLAQAQTPGVGFFGQGQRRQQRQRVASQFAQAAGSNDAAVTTSTTTTTAKEASRANAKM